MILALWMLLGCPEVEVEVEVDPTTQDVQLTEDDVDEGRDLRRMNVDQLAASIEVVTGHGWTETASGETVQLFQQLSGSLGKPDYLDQTVEDLEPGLLFQKFLGDAAKATCPQLVEDEFAAEPEDRKWLVAVEASDTPSDSPEAVRSALTRGVLHFHGRRLATSDAELDSWVWLLTEAYAGTGSAESAWRTACVAFLLHPDFYTY